MTSFMKLDEAVRKYLAWESILSEIKPLNLDPQQVKQAETQKSVQKSRPVCRTRWSAL